MVNKTILLSTRYLQGHVNAGKPTFFVEKLYNALGNYDWDELPVPAEIYHSLSQGLVGKKYHTIRKGNRFATGDVVKIKIWSGQPYKSKQITVHPGLKVKKVWHFETNGTWFKINGRLLNDTEITHLALADGLTPSNFRAWFCGPFTGQIVCWSDVVNYENEKSMDYVE